MVYLFHSIKINLIKLISILYFLTYTSLFSKEILVEVNSNIFVVKLSKTQEEKKKGLMNVKELKTFNGMLFLYEKPKILKMWMKNTFIELDIIFIDETFRVSSIKKGKKFSTKIIQSDKPVIAVLEIPTECNQKIKIEIGDIVKWKYTKKKNYKQKQLFPCLTNY